MDSGIIDNSLYAATGLNLSGTNQLFTNIDTIGNTYLLKDTANQYFSQVGTNTPTPIKNSGQPIYQDIYSEWQTLAAETVNGDNQVLWKNVSGNYLHIWHLDNSWNWVSSEGQWTLNSAEALGKESVFGIDANGDGVIGNPYTAIESAGNTKLVKDTTNKYFTQIGTNAPTAIKNGGQQIYQDIYTGWQTLAAETVNGDNQVLWKNTAGNFLLIWHLDSNWNLVSGEGNWALNSAEALGKESVFGIDANGDGVIGNPYTAIESAGNTKLVKDTTNKYFTQIGTNTPTTIKNGGQQIYQDIYTGWQTLAAETVNGDNQVLWKNTAGNFLLIWHLDSNWNLVSGEGNWALNSAEALGKESVFGIDANGDGVIGIEKPTITISASDANAGETSTGQTANPGQVTFTRIGNIASSLSVNYSVGGTATNGIDYNALNRIATFAANSSTATININPIDDAIYEGNETVVLSLVNNANYVVGTANNATVVIADNDKLIGKTDLIHFVDNDFVNVWLSNGDGTFNVSQPYTPRSLYAMSSNNYNFKTGDFNGDGKTDLIHFVNNDFVNVWLSNGDGTFNVSQPYTPRSLYAMSSNNYNFKTGDFNGDGKTDLIHFVNNDFVNVWLSNGDGTFNVSQPYTPRSLYAMSSNNYNFKTGDFNGDGKTDLIHFVNNDFVNVWLSNGDGTFNVSQPYTPRSLYAMSSNNYNFKTGDFNGDGKTDLIHFVNNDFVNVWLSNGDGTFNVSQPYTPRSLYAMSSNNYNFKTGDFNGDGKTDLIHFVNNDFVNVWLSNGDGTFNVSQPYTPRSLYAMSSNNYNFKTGDFNGDGKTDLIHFVNNDFVNVWLSNGDGTFNVSQPYTPRSLYAMSSNNYNFKTGDFNGDGKTDLIHFVNNDFVNVWLSNGDGTFNVSQPYTPRSLYAMSSNNYNFKTGDFNGDGKTDLIHFVNNDFVNVWLSNGDGTFNVSQPYTPRSLYAMSSNNYNFKTGDFNDSSNMPATYAEDNDSASYITITSPNGGESLQSGSSYNLTWTDNIAENVNIDLYKGGNFLTTLFSNTPSDGSENWTLPTNLAAGSDYSIKITSVNNGNVYDLSNGNFSVVVVTPPPPPASVWEKPLSSYTVNSEFGWRDRDGDGILEDFHGGIDLGAPTGTPIEAARSGTVIKASYGNGTKDWSAANNDGYGNLVVIDHGDGLKSYYAHLDSISVAVGTVVNINTQIGTVGSTGNSTGPHLHLEVRLNGVTKNPRDYISL